MIIVPIVIIRVALGNTGLSLPFPFLPLTLLGFGTSLLFSPSAFVMLTLPLLLLDFLLGECGSLRVRAFSSLSSKQVRTFNLEVRNMGVLDPIDVPDLERMPALRAVSLV